MRPPITVTNVDKHGKVSNQWHVKIGKKWRSFNQASWVKDGISYINDQLAKATR